MAHARIRWTKRAWGRGFLGSMLLSLGIICVACGGPVGQAAPTPSIMTSPGNTIYIQRGALRAGDGSTLWSADLGGQPPLMAGGIAYVVDPSGANGSPAAVVRAVRLADGTQAWQTAISSTVIGTGPAILAANGLLVIATAATASATAATTATAQNGSDRVVQLQLVALRASDGGLAWRTVPLAVVIEPTVDTAVPFVSQLAFAAGRIVAMADTSAANPSGTAPFAVAWNATDGSQAWRLPLSGGQYAGAGGGLWLAGDTLIAEYGGDIGALDAARGAWIWQSSYGDTPLDLVTANALVTSSNGPVLALRPRDDATLWTTNLGFPENQIGMLAASDTTIFYDSLVMCPGALTGQADSMQDVACPTIYAVSLADGKRQWQHQFPLNPTDNATNGIYGVGVIYFHYFNFKQAVLVALDAATGAQRWARVSGMGSAYFELVTAGNGIVYGIGLPNQSPYPTLEAYRATDGNPLWQKPYYSCQKTSGGGTYCPTFGRSPWVVVG